MERTSDELIKFKLFLEEFTAKHKGPITADDPLPFRLVTYRLTPDEIEGECIEWTMEYLFGLNHCPPLYAAAIAKATVEAVLASDISSYEDERDEEGKLVEANGFARFVFSTVHRICEEWNASMPPVETSPGIHQISLQAIRNTRRKMEDKHVVLQDVTSMFKSRLKNPDGKPRAFYAVYDGHGGVDASYYAAAHLHLHTIFQPDFTESPTNALKKAFNETDEAFIQKASREGLRSGTTGVAVVVEPDTVHLAWLGDSQAVLMRDGKAVTIMDPHKPDREDEKKRIEELGGCVVWFGAWRVNGSLAVSRSIGDPDYKPYVSSDADTAILPLDGTEECIILACDGLWDVVTPEDACSTIMDYIKSGSDLSGVATKLVSMAKDSRSNDNITVLVVFLNPHRHRSELPNDMDKDAVQVTEKGDHESESGSTESRSENAGDSHPKDSSSVASENNSSPNGVSQNALDANSNNNNINRNLGRKDSKVKSNSAPMTSGLVIKNGPNVILSPAQKRAAKRRSAARKLAKESDNKYSSSPDLTSDYAKTNSMPLARRRSSLTKKTVPGVRRSSSTPPAHALQKQKSPVGSAADDATVTDLTVGMRKLRSGSAKKAAPVQHSSMPITLKPKSLTRTRSLPRDPKLASIMKGKMAAGSNASDPRSDVQR
ncbi:protein phosphatase 1F-like [Diadema antillarum]|uniref:protein phosphatase 1F-like n=1 Tax=Diadema antillarum TaxID=105358 RepID=UPI003A8B3C68